MYENNMFLRFKIVNLFFRYFENDFFSGKIQLANKPRKNDQKIGK